jgi:hypothetical protein
MGVVYEGEDLKLGRHVASGNLGTGRRANRAGRISKPNPIASRPREGIALNSQRQSRFFHFTDNIRTIKRRKKPGPRP